MPTFLTRLKPLTFILCMALPIQSAGQPLAFEFVSEPLFTNGIEGPAVDSNGNLYVVNFAREGTIGMVNDLGQTQHFIDLPQGSIGNGIRFDRQDNMYVADYSGHNILKISAKTKQVEIFAHNAQMNQPNDIAISATGILYASDPNWQQSNGQLWMIDTQGKTFLLEKEMGTTNGIEVSHDEKHLYVNESVQRNVWIYDILENGKLENKRLFYQFNDHGLDGMRVDNQGNLYIARYGAGIIAVLSTQGELKEEIKLTGQFPTNVAFGGKEGKQVFVTLQKKRTIDTFTASHAGRSFTLRQTK